jgi:hypothetical protein
MPKRPTSQWVEHILSAYDRADRVTLDAGHSWYAREHAAINGVHAKVAIPRCAVFACYAIASPRQQWGRVRDSLYDFLVLGKASALEGMLPHIQSKLWAIVEGGANWHLFVQGDKTRSFYENLRHPDSSLAVTVDVHAWNVMWGHDTPRTLIPGMRKSDYKKAEAAYRAAAAEIGRLPSQVQATTWLVERYNSSRQ